MLEPLPGPGGRARAWGGPRTPGRGAPAGGPLPGPGGGRRRRPATPWATPATARPLLAGDRPVVLTPHDGEYARLAGRGPRTRPDGRRPPTGRRDRRGGPAQGVAHRGGRARRDGDGNGRVLLSAAGTPRLATAGTGRRAVRGDRRLAGPGGRRRRRRRRWPPTSTAGRPGWARPRGWWPATCPVWWPAGSRGPSTRCREAVVPTRRREAGVAEGRSRPAWAEIDLGGRPPQRRGAAPPGRPGRAVRRGEGRRLRPRRPGGGPGGGRGRRRLAGGGPGRRGGRAA